MNSPYDFFGMKVSFEKQFLGFEQMEVRKARSALQEDVREEFGSISCIKGDHRTSLSSLKNETNLFLDEEGM